MNILLAASGMQSGGAETHIVSLCRCLLQRGHKITLASSGGVLAVMLEKEGVRCVTLPLTGIAPRTAASAFFGLLSLVRRGEFDIVHAHTRAAALYCDAVCSLLGKPLVVTCHARFKMEGAKGRLTRTGTRCIAVSEDIALHVKRRARKQKTESLTVIRNGIDTRMFSPKANPSVSARRIIFVSRLDSDCSSAAYALCSAAPALARRFRELEILIVGGGSEYRKICEEAKKSNALCGREIVIALGERKRLVPLLQGASAFVGVSRAALEAMSCAVPAVLCGDEGFLGLLDSEQKMHFAEKSNFCCRDCGVLSPSALSRELVRVLSMDNCEREMLGELGRRYVCTYHSARHMAIMTEGEYRAARQGVLLCGYYGYGNLGDEALAIAARKRAGEIWGESRVEVLTHNPRKRAEHERMSPTAVLSALRRSDTLVLGGGTLLQNDTSRRSLFYYLCLIGLARMLGRRVELWGNGLQEVRGRLAQKALRAALLRCSYVGVRDEQSALFARECGVEDGKIHLEADLAAKTACASERAVRKILCRMGIPKTQKYMIIAAKRGKKKNAYALALCVKKLKERGIVPIFLAMYPREDAELAYTLQKKLGGAISPPLSPSEAIGLMRGAYAVLASRYHAVIFARAANTRVIIFSDEEKLNRLKNDKKAHRIS